MAIVIADKKIPASDKPDVGFSDLATSLAHSAILT
jgi:hypothetical protein